MDRRDAIKRASLICGIAVGSPLVISIINGCVPEKTVDWKPRFFTKDQAVLIADISDIILPRTDTPGALDVGVDAFVDFIVDDCYSNQAQQSFIQGMIDLNKKSISVGGDEFISIAFKKKTELLTALDTKADNQSFYPKLKRLILLGYFTSKEIMTNYLDYVPVPTRLEGCTPLKTGQKIIIGNQI